MAEESISKERTIIVRCKSSTDDLKLLGFIGRALHTCFDDSAFTMEIVGGPVGKEYRYNVNEDSKGMPVREVERVAEQGYLFPPIDERSPLR